MRIRGFDETRPGVITYLKRSSTSELSTTCANSSSVAKMSNKLQYELSHHPFSLGHMEQAEMASGENDIQCTLGRWKIIRLNTKLYHTLRDRH